MTETEYKEMVYAKAKNVRTSKDLTRFLKELCSYQHDYGTIVYACSAAAKAAFRVVNESPSGGITGFQAGCLMWEMVEEFGSFSKGPLRIFDYDHLLYPQYDFTHELSSKSAEQLQDRAKAKLKESSEYAHEEVILRWQQIASGHFPAFIKIKD